MQSRRSNWSLVSAAFALTLMLAASVSAQSPLGRLAGTVFDTSGAVLPGATATLTNEGTGQTQTTVSNETGAFLFPQVPVGTYKLDVSLPSFKSASFTGISIAVGQEYSITAKLALGNVSEVVSVEAGSSLVPTTTPEVSQTIDQKQIETLPLNGRNPIELDPADGGRPRHRQPRQRRHQRRPADLDRAVAGRHQHPGQLHPDQLAGVRPEPSDDRQRRRSSRSPRPCRAPTTRAARRRCAW